MANQYLKLDPIDDDDLQVQGGKGGYIRPKQKWPVTTMTLSGLNNKSLAKELWDALGNDKKAAGVNDSNFASAVNMVIGLSTKVSIGDKTYWFIKKKEAIAFEEKLGDDCEDTSKADGEYNSNNFVKKVSEIFNEIK